jgi:hypothetical protein
MNEKPGNDELQGEGNYDAARNYRKHTEQFIDSGRVGEAARNAVPRSAEEADELERAEERGRERSAEEDPGLRR